MRATVQGRRFELLDTVETALFMADVWRDLGHSLGHVFASGVVVLVRPQVAYATVEPFIPFGSLYALGWEVAEMPTDPVDRFQEALRQERLRAEERLTGATGLAPLPRR
jgi:hypothetical protein